MPGYLTKQERVHIVGAPDLLMESLLDQQQYADPHFDAEGVGISSATWPIFGLLWPSGAQLADRLVARRRVPAERVLEVGCGLGLATLAGHRMGMDITASDIHPLAGRFMAANATLNGLTPINYRHGPWRGGAVPAARRNDAPLQALTGQFDLIIGSDLLYDRGASADLASFIHTHAMAQAEVWIVDPDRGNRPGFNRDMVRLGFAMTEYRLDQASLQGRPAYKGRMLTYRRALLEPSCSGQDLTGQTGW